MEENIKQIMRIYQKHQMMNRVGLCCSDDRPCDMVALFDEIKRLNGQIAVLKTVVEGLASVAAVN